MTLTSERLREVLRYDPVTGVWTWLRSCGRAPAGSRAGWMREDGYREIGVEGQRYRSHRLAVFYMTGEWPADHVDHKNVTPGDDRWENLRPANRHQNKANAPLRRDSTSGFKGVSWSERRRTWRAYIFVRQKQKHLGQFDTPEAAHAAYVAAAKEHFGEFARSA